MLDMECSIIIAGDLCPKDRVASAFIEGKYEDVLGEVRPLIEDVDYALVNLEAPIVKGEGVPIKKSGPNLKCDVNVIEAIKYAGFKGVTLANNHFFDYGEEGALNTFTQLKRHGVDFVGAGRNIKEAARTLYVNIHGATYAFINCCEHEFSIATNSSAGSNPLDVIEQYNAIVEARKKAMFTIVIVHGGIEMYQLPTPRMVKTYHYFVDAGADAVVNHHQHCYSGFEYYRGKPIVYGLGNFCFDWAGKKNEIWHEGYLAELVFKEGKIQMIPIPYRQCDEKPTVQLSVIDINKFRSQLSDINDIILDEKKLEGEYENLLNKTWKNYDIFNPYTNRYLAWLHKKGVLPTLLPRRRLYAILNTIRCVSHQERLLYAITKLL